MYCVSIHAQRNDYIVWSHLGLAISICNIIFFEHIFHLYYYADTITLLFLKWYHLLAQHLINTNPFTSYRSALTAWCKSIVTTLCYWSRYTSVAPIPWYGFTKRVIWTLILNGWLKPQSPWSYLCFVDVTMLLQKRQQGRKSFRRNRFVITKY